MADAERTGYEVVARRFRPKTFDEVVGQETVLRSLRSALASERVPHAFLFSGSRGVGKTTMARILARALNCETNGVSASPCGTCPTCVSILAGGHPDVVEIDAASHNLVDDVRELRERVGFASMGARYKVYILDEVHMLTRSAFNAFLKTLEEPPANVVFVLATTELHKVPETIRSRCQVLLFRRVGEADIVSRLGAICAHEGLEMPDDVLRDIAASSRGGMRDAETALERVLPVAHELGAAFDLATYRQLVARVGIDRVVDVVEALLDGDARAALHFVDEAVQTGVDEREALGEVVDVLRSILLLKLDGEDSGLVALAGDHRERLVARAASTPVERLDAMVQAGLNGRERIRRLDDRRLVFELALVRMAQAGQLPTLHDLVAALESGGSNVALAAPAAPGAPPAAAAAAAAAPTAGGDLRGQLLAWLRENKPMLTTTVEQCAVAGPGPDGRVAFTLRSDRKMHRDRLQSQPVQDLLRQALRAILGKDVGVVVAGGDTAPAASPAASRAEPGPDVKRVAKRFDGKIVDLDEEIPDA